MAVTELVFETHSTTEDNEHGVATGWLPGTLSARGRAQARAMGARRQVDRLAAVFTSDLQRALETTQIAFANSAVPVLHDWRLRECNYGDRNGMPTAELHRDRRLHLDVPYPGGESWRQAVARVSRFLHDLPSQWAGSRAHRRPHGNPVRPRPRPPWRAAGGPARCPDPVATRLGVRLEQLTCDRPTARLRTLAGGLRSESIATTALEHGLGLVTRHRRDFDPIRGVRIRALG